MAIEHAESFDIYGTDVSLMLENGYASVSQSAGTLALADDPDGISSQRCMRFVANSGQGGSSFRYTLLTSTDVMGIALRLWMSSLPGNTGQCPKIMIFSDDGNNTIAWLQVDTTGRLSFCSDDGTVLGTTTSPVITAEGWWHIEAKFDGSGGDAATTFEVRVEGVTKLDLSDLTLDSYTVYQTTHASDGDFISAHPEMFMKDMVWWNDSGTENNDFLGAVRVVNLAPTEDIDLGDWSPSTGTTGFDILDNNPPDDDEYLEAGETAADPMKFEMSDLPDDVSSVKAVLTFVRAAKIDGGDGKIQVSLISDGTAGNGTDREITAAQLYWKDVHEVDPDTSSAWSPSAVDAVQLSIDRTE